jgi:hypothetical protein
MTPEQRLDRLERVAKLLANAGRRARRDLRHDVWNHDHKINYLANLQIANEDRFAKLANLQIANEDRFAKLAESQAHLDESHARLAESQSNTNQRLDELIEIIKEGRNGGSLRNN